MDIKQASVNLLLKKIRIYLNAQSVEKKKEKRFIEAEKALAKLEKLCTEKVGTLQLVSCRSKTPVIDG
jgi:hypothetical protein